MSIPVRGIEDNHILDPEQKTFLREFTKSDLKDVFRLSGGTALSAFYLEHRLSQDLDFFSSEKIPFYLCEEFLKTLDNISEIFYTKYFDRNIFNLKLNDSTLLKVEFTYYPLNNFEDTTIIEGLQIDGFLDIVVNKLCAIADRTNAKDYVDLYCALLNTRLSLEYLIGLAEKKCGIKGIHHILKSRLLKIPEGVSKIPLKVDLKEQDIENRFKKLIKKIIEKEIGSLSNM